ncbi:hypothetical protein H4F64_02855 [Pectobacterium brasiliense]|uniref:hypothetical protein n=1 Tax=Pectobacterium brasiliense TaxID=180957 RepID=UPI0019690051|nr:hypothetical protein [Pectobacterium brasiliense]MBN3189152.1 hypothetical protein [Pectobacterium brasiliense]
MAIPEKDFFTLNEIIHRWRFAGMDSTTLLKLAMDDLLVFSIYVQGIGSHTSIGETPDGTVGTNHTVHFSFKAKGYSRPSIQYLKSGDTRRILEAMPDEKTQSNISCEKADVLVGRRQTGTSDRDKLSGQGYFNGS